MPESAAEPVGVALDLTATLNALGVAYVVGGSLASSVHGEPRATNDVDLVAALDARSGGALVERLAGRYYVDADAVQAAIADVTSFNAIHLASAVKVDVFVAGSDAFEAERLRQRLAVPLGSGTLCVDTAENTILRKLEWYRRGGEVSERQWRDVAAIIRLQHKRLDREHLARWARYLGVVRLLKRALEKGGS